MKLAGEAHGKREDAHDSRKKMMTASILGGRREFVCWFCNAHYLRMMSLLTLCYSVVYSFFFFYYCFEFN